MSDEVSSAELLYDECCKENPDMIKINEYIIRCCNNKVDINLRFNCYKWTPLHMACYRGHHEIVKRLLENSINFQSPIDVNTIEVSYDDTPLHFACKTNFPLTVRTLLLHPNIDVNKGNFSKTTPLHRACCNSTAVVVIELLKHRNINLDATNDDGETPLHYACSCGVNDAVVQLLLDHATITDINATDHVGDTPLHKICSRYDLDSEIINVIRNLLKQPSIIIDKKNNNYETPLEICKMNLDCPSYAHDEIVQLFEDFRNQQRWRVFCFLMKYDLC